MYSGSNIYDLKTIEYTAGYIHANVIKTQKELADGEYVGFYIPKIMGLIDATDGPVEKSVSLKTTFFANSSKSKPKVSGSITSINYMKIKPIHHSNFTQPVIALGESCYMVFIDGDYKFPRYTYEHNNEVKRPTDHVSFYVYGKPNGDDEQGDAYKVTLSSRDKYIGIHMSKDNGEHTTFDLRMDGETGATTLFDGEGNIIGLDTKNTNIYAKNIDGTEVQLTKKNITMKCTDDCTIDCDNFKVNAKTNIQHDAGAKIAYTAPKVYVEGSTAIDFKTVNWSANVDAQFKCTCPLSIYSGILTSMGLSISPSAGSPPGTILVDGAGATLTKSPNGPVAFGDKAVTTISMMIPFLKIAPIAALVLAPMLPLIPSKNVKM